MTVEILRKSKEFEQIIHHETERKLLPVFPEHLMELRSEAVPLEQYYLSHLSEPFSLRFRETFREGVLSYEVTLKDTGELTSAGVKRIEVETTVPAELYTYYFDEHTTPVLRKLRSEPVPGVIVDFYDDNSLQVEAESPEGWAAFTARYGDNFVDIGDDRVGNNEWRAHLSFRRLHDGQEALVPESELTSQTIIDDILLRRSQGRPLIVHIGGRSGSGKSTVVREVCAALDAIGMTNDVVSTDDYHRGTSWLTHYNGGQTWTHWDDPIVYDTVAMAHDLAALTRGESIVRREIDWTVAEPRAMGAMTMPDVLLIEGIYANSPDISSDDDLVYEMTTPLATCIGRRLLRDIRERPEFADPEKSLLYMLSEAEPAYRAQLAARSQLDA